MIACPDLRFSPTVYDRIVHDLLQRDMIFFTNWIFQLDFTWVRTLTCSFGFIILWANTCPIGMDVCPSNSTSAIWRILQLDPKFLLTCRNTAHSDKSCKILIIGDVSCGKSHLAAHLLDIIPAEIKILNTFFINGVEPCLKFQARHEPQSDFTLDDIAMRQDVHAQKHYREEQVKLENHLSIIEDLLPRLPPEVINIIRRYADAIPVHLVPATLVVEEAVFMALQRKRRPSERRLVKELNQNVLTILVGGIEKADYAFLFGDKFATRHLYLQWGHAFPNFRSFRLLLSRLKRYECLFVNLTDTCNGMPDSIYWYMAPSPK